LEKIPQKFLQVDFTAQSGPSTVREHSKSTFRIRLFSESAIKIFPDPSPKTPVGFAIFLSFDGTNIQQVGDKKGRVFNNDEIQSLRE
jgi:hypothetical protein